MSGIGSAVWCEALKPPPLPPPGTSMYVELMEFIQKNTTLNGFYKEYTEACNQTFDITTGRSTEVATANALTAVMITLALIVVVAVLVVLFYLWKRHKKRTRSSSSALSMDQYEKKNYLHNKAETEKPWMRSSNADSPDAPSPGTIGTECGSKLRMSNPALESNPAATTVTEYEATTKAEIKRNSQSSLSSSKNGAVKRFSGTNSGGGHDNPIYHDCEEMVDISRRSQNNDGLTDVNRRSQHYEELADDNRRSQNYEKVTDVNRQSQNSEGLTDVRRRSHNINGLADRGSGQNDDRLANRRSQNNDGQVEVNRRSRNGSVSKTGIVPLNVPDSSENRVSNGHAKLSSDRQGVGGGSLPPINTNGINSEKRQSGDGKKKKKKRGSSKRGSVETSGEIEETESSHVQNDSK